MYSRTETQWWSPANVSSQRVAGLTGREGFACHEPATLSYYTSLPVFVTSVYRYVALLNMRQPPLSFIIHYSAVFIAPIGYYRICIYIYSISISRVSTTYFHDAGIREVEGKEVEKRKKGDASYLEISMDGNLIFFFPSFSLFPRVPLCSIPVKLSRPLFNRGPNENKAG